MTPHVRLLVGLLVSQSVTISCAGRYLHFNAFIGALLNAVTGLTEPGDSSSNSSSQSLVSPETQTASLVNDTG